MSRKTKREKKIRKSGDEKKMKKFENFVDRPLSADEMTAIIEAGRILSAVFKRPIFSVQVNPNKVLPTDVWGIAFAFDMDNYREAKR